MKVPRRRRAKRFFGGRPGKGAIVTVRLGARYVEFLDNYAETYGVTRSSVMREMLEQIAIPALKQDPKVLERRRL